MLDEMKKNSATTMLVIGIMLVAVNATLITSTFDGLISDGMAQQVTDAYDEEADFDEEWATSTSEKVYFGYNLTDVDIRKRQEQPKIDNRLLEEVLNEIKKEEDSPITKGIEASAEEIKTSNKGLMSRKNNKDDKDGI